MDSEIVLLCSMSPSVVSCVLIILAPNGMSSIILSCSVVGVVLQIKVVLHLQLHLAVYIGSSLGSGVLLVSFLAVALLNCFQPPFQSSIFWYLYSLARPIVLVQEAV